MNKKFQMSIAAFAIAASVQPALGQDGGPNQPAAAVEEKEEPDLEEVSKAFDPLFANDNPTFGMLGVGQSDIQAPETPAELAMGLLNGLDQNGNFQQGFAFEFAPAQLFAGKNLTVKRYREEFGWLERSLARLQLGIGAAKGTSDADPSLKIGAGFVWQPINGLDPLKNGPRYICTDEARAVFRADTANPENAPGTPGRARVQKKLNDAIAACRMKNPVMLDNTFNLQFSAAFLANSITGETKDLRMNGYTFGTNASIGLSGKDEVEEVKDWRDAKQTRGRLILSAGFRGKENVPDPITKGAFLNRDRIYGGARFAWGIPQRYELNFESVYQSSDYTDGRNDGYLTFTGAVDYRLMDKVWLGAKFGSSVGSSVAEDATYIGTVFKVAFGNR